MKATRVFRHLASNTAIQVLNIATSLVIITFLSFAEIAVYAVVMLVAGPMGLLGTLRLEWILMNTKSRFAATLIARAGMFIALSAGPLALGLMLTFQALGLFNFELPSMFLFLAGALFCFTFAANRIITVYHLTQNSIRENTRLRTVHAAGRFAFSLLLCSTTNRAEAVFIGEILAAILFFLLCGERHVFVGFIKGFNLRWAWLWRRERKMLLSSTPSAVLSSISSNIVPVVIISVVGVDAGGIAYTVQRLAGIPVKFALLTVGEVWHKMVYRGDNLALRLARSPRLLLLGMAVILLAMVALVNVAVIMAHTVEGYFTQSQKIATVATAVHAYQLFFGVALAGNLFNRVLVMRSVIHRKLFFDVVFLLAPFPLFFLPEMISGPLQVNTALFALSVFQAIAYGVLATLILYEARAWQREAIKQPD